MVGYDDGVMRMQRVREGAVPEMIEWTSRKMISPVDPSHQRPM